MNSEWSGVLLQIIVSAATAASAVSARLWSLLNRFAKVEREAAELREQFDGQREDIRKMLVQFSVDLEKHEQEDAKRFDKVDSQYAKLYDMLLPMSESVKQIKETMGREYEKIHTRISTHYERQAQQVETVKKTLGEYGEKIAVLENNTPPKPKRRPPR